VDQENMGGRRHESLKAESGSGKTVPLSSIASIVRQTLNPQSRSAEACQYVVFATSDVREGVVIGKKEPVQLSEVASVKKRFKRHDVLISRSRPHLRQVAFVDDEVLGPGIEAELACSTEFFVLRSKTSESIAFLVPFLLSRPVQKVLSASHPRFYQGSVLTLPVPERLLADRGDCSAEVIRGIVFYRRAEHTLAQLIESAENAIAPKDASGKVSERLRR
jgi:hypothetical protein